MHARITESAAIEGIKVASGRKAAIQFN